MAPAVTVKSHRFSASRLAILFVVMRLQRVFSRRLMSVVRLLLCSDSHISLLTAFRSSGQPIFEADLVGNGELAKTVYDPKRAEVEGMPLKTTASIAEFFGASAKFHPMKG